jgi:hypothetical protein
MDLSKVEVRRLLEAAASSVCWGLPQLYFDGLDPA